METIQVGELMNDLKVHPYVRPSINRLLSRKLNQNTDHKDNLKQRSNKNIKLEKAALEQKRFQKKEQISFLAKIYLDQGITTCNSQKRGSKRKIQVKNSTTPIKFFRDSIDFQMFTRTNSFHSNNNKFNFDKQPIERINLNNNKGNLKSKRKRDTKSAVSRSVAYPKLTIQVPANNYMNQTWSRKTSSTCKKIDITPTGNIQYAGIIQKNMNLRPIKSVPFVKNIKYYSGAQSKCLRKLLQSNGFKQYQGSGPIKLRWTEYQNFQDYESVQIKIIKYYNHIKNNLLVSKQGMHKVYKLLYEQNCHPYKFMLRIYNHQESKEYQNDYKLNSVLILLDKHIEYCKSRQPMFTNLQKLWRIKQNRQVTEESLDSFISRKQHFSLQRRSDYVINSSMCLLMLKALQQERYKNMDCLKPTYQKIQDKQFKNLIKFSKLANNYDEYAKNQYSPIKLQKLSGVSLTSQYKNSRWQTPSLELIMKFIFYKEYFKKIYPSGWGNLWAVHSIQNKQIKVTKQMISFQKQMIVQKCIQNSHKDIGQLNMKLDQQLVFNESKWQMIQPVLIKSVEPLIVYTYQQCYYKIFDQINQQLQCFQQQQPQQDYFITQQTFKQYFIQNQQTQYLNQIKTLTTSYIKGIIKVSSMQMCAINGCFQLLNFHIQLKQNKYPQIVNISRSSQIDKNNLLLQKYNQILLTNTINIVMTKQHIKSNTVQQQNYWVQLIKQRPKDIKQKTWLQVRGKKINNLKLIAKDEKVFSRNPIKQINYIIQFQRSIRNYMARYKANINY